jgi:nucleotide-binding universal stress UspA family protein
MKTIAVLTDFSGRAENAAKYALRLAQSLHTNLVLYNSFLVPSANPLAAQIAWPMEDYDQLHSDSENELELLAVKLRKELHVRQPDTFRPVIISQCHEGSLSRDLGELLTNRDVVLLVMASHDKSIATLLLGDHVRELLDHTTLPLLIIGDHYSFKKIRNIAFATDLHMTDIDVIHSLAGLAGSTNAQITLIHIGARNTDEGAVKKFMTQVSGKINYPHIYYRQMASALILDEIITLDESSTYDMLVMVHRHKGFWEELFNQSDTQKMATQINLPLLVYPFPTGSLPVFN